MAVTAPKARTGATGLLTGNRPAKQKRGVSKACSVEHAGERRTDLGQVVRSHGTSTAPERATEVFVDVQSPVLKEQRAQDESRASWWKIELNELSKGI